MIEDRETKPSETPAVEADTTETDTPATVADVQEKSTADADRQKLREEIQADTAEAKAAEALAAVAEMEKRVEAARNNVETAKADFDAAKVKAEECRAARIKAVELERNAQDTCSPNDPSTVEIFFATARAVKKAKDDEDLANAEENRTSSFYLNENMLLDNLSSQLADLQQKAADSQAQAEALRIAANAARAAFEAKAEIVRAIDAENARRSSLTPTLCATCKHWAQDRDAESFSGQCRLRPVVREGNLGFDHKLAFAAFSVTKGDDFCAEGAPLPGAAVHRFKAGPA